MSKKYFCVKCCGEFDLCDMSNGLSYLDSGLLLCKKCYGTPCEKYAETFEVLGYGTSPLNKGDFKILESRRTGQKLIRRNDGRYELLKTSLWSKIMKFFEIKYFFVGK